MRKTGYGMNLPLVCAAWLAAAFSLSAEPQPEPAGAASLATAAGSADTLGLPPLDELESKVRSTLLFGGSSPVSFSGEARLRISEHDFYNNPSFLNPDQTWTQANWEGNESMLRLGMVARPNRNAVLWTKIGFQSTLPGIYENERAEFPDNFTRSQDRHDKSDIPAIIHEDMAAGLAIRTVPASFMVRMGNVLWTEASPLTIWKAQPRNFAWDYLPYEVEQPIARYYEYNIAKGEKSGRAAWNKKAFNGVDFRSIDLPWGLQTNLMWATFERYDNFEREYIDFANDLGLANLSPDPNQKLIDSKQIGIGDSYRHVLHARVAMAEAVGKTTLGINYVGLFYKPDITQAVPWRQNFKLADTLVTEPATGQRLALLKGTGFYKQPHVASAELRGPLSDKIQIHFDAAVSMMDTVWSTFRLDSAIRDTAGRARYRSLESQKHTPFGDMLSQGKLGLYARINSSYGVPVQADLAYLAKGFYSPFSFAAPVDGFFPFGSNLVGAGKFIGRGEGSPYTQNMAGVLLSVSPQIGYGHLRFAYGQHFQVEKAQDVLYFPYRLNGQDYNSVFQSSYNRWGNNLIDHSLPGAKYAKRLGDESYTSLEYQNPVGYGGGGLRSDYLSMFESFVPYENAAQADSNLTHFTNIFTRSKFVPVHQKFTFNLEADAAWDIAPFIGYSHDFFVSAYAALNGISSTLQPVAFSQKDMMLWGLYLRAEPAVALTDKLYLLGLAGYENWRSDMAYMKDALGVVVSKPINYVDMAFGAGFDWDFAARVGFHFRYKWMKHEDKEFTANTWATPYVSGEIKMWF